MLKTKAGNLGEVEINTYEGPQSESEIDYENARDVVSHVSDRSSEVIELRIKNAINFFRLGCDLAKDKSGMSLREWSAMTGIPYRTLGGYRQVAEKLEYNETKMLEELDKIPTHSWYGLENKLLSRKVKNPRKAVQQLLQQTGSLLRDWKEGKGDDEMDKIAAELCKIRNVITRYIPWDQTIRSVKYLNFSECCCCGDMSIPVGGYELQEWSARHIKVPVCKACQEEGREVNPVKVAHLYAGYAINMENFLYRLDEHDSASE